jgi:hypothetical protein
MFPRLCGAPRLALLALAFATPASAATLLRQNFGIASAWPALAARQSAAAGAVTASATHSFSAGTITAYGASTASGGLLLSVNSSAATGPWTATLDSGVLSLLAPNTRGLGFLTLAFSLEASSAHPVRVRIESYDNASVRTGGLQTLVFPAAGDFYQRYALDLDKMTPDGPGAFVPTDPKVRIFFELDSAAGATGWPAAAGHTLRIDNLNYSTPKYYVKPASLGGSNSADGLTEATALATVQAAANKTLSGDNIIAILQDDTPGGVDYDESNVNGDMVNISKPGAPDAWIVFKNYPGHAPVLRTAGWNVFRICNNSSGGSAAYVEVRGLTARGHSSLDANGDRQLIPAFQQYIGLVDSRSNGNGISVDIGFNNTNLPHNIRVADCVMEFLAGTNGGSGDRLTFENNLIRNNAWWMRYAGSGISFGFAKNTEANANPAVPTYRRLIRDNLVYGNECMVPWNRGTSNPYSDGNGIIIDSDTAAYDGKTLVLNNLVFNNGGSGIHVLKANNVDIIHNTAYLNSASTSLAYGQIFTQSFSNAPDEWVKNVRVTNNIMVAPRNPTGVNSYLYNESATSFAAFDPSTIVHTRNLYVGGDNTPSLSGANRSNNTDLGRTYNAAALFLSPSIDPAVADFRLRASAPARDYGANISYRSFRDLAGTPRPPSAPTDSGAYQTITNLAYSPIFSPAAGKFSAPQNVTLASDTADAVIVYTTDGTTPSVNALGAPTRGTLYNAAIPVSATTTLRAIAWKAGLATSPAATAIYDFQNLGAVPVTLALDTATGIYPGNRIVQPLTRTPAAWIRYTTNGADPTSTTGTPHEYRGYTVTDYAHLRYRAFKTGRAPSAVVSARVTVHASLGNLADGSTLTTFGANRIRFARFHAAESFSAAQIFARINGLAGHYRAAIYADVSGAPGDRLALSSLVTNPATGWTAFPLASRTTLTSGTTYWLAIWSDNAFAGIHSTPTGGTVREATATFTTSSTNNANWPSPVPSPATVSDTANYALYATNLPPNLAPLVSAGPDQNVPLAATATLPGTATDDGVPLAPGTLTSTWSKVSGPGTVTFANSASAATTAALSAEGTYVLRLTARDALLTTTDDVTLTVTAGTATALDPSPPAGVVRARFTDGPGTFWPQQYPGVTGDGWAGPWSASSLATPAVSATSPLRPDSGNYLAVSRTGGSGTVLQGVVREWSSTNRPPTAFARLTFDVRLDSPAAVFDTNGDNLTLTARPTTGTTSAVDSTFFIRAFGAPTGSLQTREWGVYDGDGVNTAYDASRFIPAGLVCEPGVTYSFTIDLFGAPDAGTTRGKAHGTYDVTITDGTATVRVLGARYRSAAYPSGGYLSFSTQQNLAADNLSFSVDSIELGPLAATATTLVSDTNPADPDTSLTFTATVAVGGATPVGAVTFLENGEPLGSADLDANGVATFSSSALAPGTHVVTAVFAASPGFTASTSAPLAQTIRASTLTTLTTSANPASLGAALTLAATVGSDGATPSGTVTFFDGAVPLGSSALDASGLATLVTGALSPGPHVLTAAFAATPDFTASTSAPLDQLVRTAYASWTHATGLDALGEAAPTADPDGDGANNFLEYALDGDPIASDADILPTLQVSGLNSQPFLSLSFFRARPDLIYAVEATSDLAAPVWPTLATNPGTIGEWVAVEDDPEDESPRRFLRLRVTQP